MARQARTEVRAAARRLADDDRVLALCLGNEIPADVIRWYGARSVSRLLAGLAESVRSDDPDCLLSYGNYPTSEYLPLETFDFLTVNVFLEHQKTLRAYLTRLQHLAGSRPLVIGELGSHASDGDQGEAAQATMLDWQLSTALERGVAGTCTFS